MAYITRKKENKIPEIIGFSLGEVLHGTAPDILLQKDDQVEIRSLFDYREGESVSIWGAVKSPGNFPLIENITLKDLIFKARGFTEMASTDSVELIRVIKDQKTLLTTDQKTIVMKFALDKDLNFANGSGDMLLENGDQVIVRTISGYEGIRMVRVEGEVLQPGSYNITNKYERISDLVKRTGGFSRYAYPLGAYLIRKEHSTGVELKLKQIMAENAKKQIETKEDNAIDVSMLKAAGATDVQDASKIVELKDQLTGSSNIEEIFKTEGIVGINLQEIMRHPGSRQDLYLEEGDVLYVPREIQTVRILGEVLFPTYVQYRTGMSFKNYINNAGGYSDRAQKKRAFILYANGTAKGTKLSLIHI
jgi:protein involved in polysaccharide export with SLBB domain